MSDLPLGLRNNNPGNIRPSNPPWQGATGENGGFVVFDTMVQWGGMKPGGSLDKLCRALGMPGKNGFDGSMVWDAVKAGEFAKVQAYCVEDVEKVRAIHKRMTFATEALAIAA